MARMGGVARAKAHSKDELRRRRRPARLGRKAVSRLMWMLAQGKSQAECARVLGVSVRTIGHAVAPTRSGENPQTSCARS